MGQGSGLRALAGLFGACALLAAGQVRAADTPPPEDFAVVNARVFDGERVVPGATAVVRQGRIASVGKAKPPAGLKTVDGAGKTLLPGLIDAHSHITAGRADALRFGVTTELDMFGQAAELPSLRREREAMGPAQRADVFASGTLATAPGGHGTEYGLPIPTLTAADQADAWVAARVAEGSDYIKVVYQPSLPGMRASPSIDRATLDALVKAGHARGKLVVVHVHTRDAAVEALAAGADGLAHIFSDVGADPDFYRTAKAARMFVVPTLSVIAGIGDPSHAQALAADARIGPYLSPGQRAQLERSFGGRSPAFDLDVALKAVGALSAAGVDVMAGTDAGNPATTHGATLHQELTLLVRAGLTPTQALAAATSVPARRFKLEDRGRIAPGYRADLLLVDGDPTARIEDSRAIAAIWKNGYPVARATFAAASATAAPKALTGLIGGFETDLSGPDGLVWDRSSDAIAGGKSEATIARVTPGASGGQGAMRMTGEVRPGGLAIWAGAQMPFSPTFSTPRDLSGAAALVFSVRGTVPQGAVLMTSSLAGAWPTVTFPITPQWTQVRLPLADFKGLNPKAALALVVSAGAAPGPFQIDIDEVRLE